MGTKPGKTVSYLQSFLMGISITMNLRDITQPFTRQRLGRNTVENMVESCEHFSTEAITAEQHFR